MQTLDHSYSEQAEQFRQLQIHLRDRWQTVELFDNSDADILSHTFPKPWPAKLLKIEGVHHYEERLLFSLIRLQNPKTRLIYVTSQPLHPASLITITVVAGIPFSHADRLLLLSTYDSSLKPLTQKKF